MKKKKDDKSYNKPYVVALSVSLALAMLAYTAHLCLQKTNKYPKSTKIYQEQEYKKTK